MRAVLMEILPALQTRRQDLGGMREKESFLERSYVVEEMMERLLTIEEAAQALKVRKSWLYSRIHAGTLPFSFVKVGHYVRIPAKGIREYIRCATVSPDDRMGPGHGTQ